MHFRMCHIAVATVFVLFWTNPAMSENTVVAVALAGDSIVLNCTKNTTNWHFIPLNHTGHNHGDKDIYTGGEDLAPGIDKNVFSLTGNRTVGEVNLIITNVTFEWAGVYTCSKDSTTFIRYKLIVLVCRVTPLSDDRTVLCTGSKSHQECSGFCSSPQDGDLFRAPNNEFIGPNTCNIPRDRILVSCSVTYFDKEFPVLELRNLRDNKIAEMSCNTTDLDAKKNHRPTGFRLTCNVTLDATMDLYGAQYIWQTSQSTKTQYNCTTEPIKILYAFNSEASQQTTVSKGDKVVCTANSSISCTYKWVWHEEVEDDLSRTIESTNNTLIASKIGLHRCEAQCKLRNQTCRIFPQYIKVIETQENLTNIEDPSALIHQCTYSFSGQESERTTVSKGDKVVCNNISSFSCTYKWVWYEEVEDDLSRTIESTNNTLIAKKIGLHRCEAHCKLRNHTCTIFTQYIKVIESEENLTNIGDTSALIHQWLEKENNQSLWTPPLIVLLILGILQYLTFGCYLLTRMRRKTATPDGNHEMTSRTNSQVELSPVHPSVDL